MDNNNEVLKLHISEQIALEERLYKSLEDKMADIPDTGFIDAKSLLSKVAEVLEGHFVLLNKMLGKLEDRDAETEQENQDGKIFRLDKLFESNEQSWRVSKILREVYSELNLISISNTQLHTAGLALKSEEVALMALKHVQNITPLIVSLGELIPEILTQELNQEASEIDKSASQTAIDNIRKAWDDL